MDVQKLNDWMQVVGIFGLIASLVFVGFEMKQTDDIAIDAVFDSINMSTIEFASLVTENADVWARGCLDEELSDAEQVKFGQIYAAWNTASFLGWKRLAVANLVEADPQFAINSFAANLYRYPGLLKHARSMSEWDANGRQFSDPDVEVFVQGVRAHFAVLAEEEPIPLGDVTWCGRL